jgi:hypothetical protein
MEMLISRVNTEKEERFQKVLLKFEKFKQRFQWRPCSNSRNWWSTAQTSNNNVISQALIINESLFEKVKRLLTR